MRKRAVREASERALMLSDLRTVLTYPYLLDQCVRKTRAETLRGLGKWMRLQRRCKVCNRRMPPSREKCCSPKCSARWNSWKHIASDRKAGKPVYPDFVRAVKAPIGISLVAEKKNLDLPEARRLAEGEVTAGRLVAWRGRHGGDIREVGLPR